MEHPLIYGVLWRHFRKIILKIEFKIAKLNKEFFLENFLFQFKFKKLKLMSCQTISNLIWSKEKWKIKEWFLALFKKMMRQSMNGSDKFNLIISNKLKKKLNKLFCLPMNLMMSKISLMIWNLKVHHFRFKINSLYLRTMKWASTMINSNRIWQTKTSSWSKNWRL